MNSIPEILEDVMNGKMVILMDDENRENEGDIILPADFVTPNAINFMAKEARGLICLALTSQQCERLNLPLMVIDEENWSPNKTAFTVSIESALGVSTGISAADRARTIRVASNPNATPKDIIRPGHIFPIRAQNGGVLRRAGHTEASVDLARLAGLNPSSVICEIMLPDGEMARTPDLIQFASEHGLKMGTIEDLIRYRLENETLVEEILHEKIVVDQQLFAVKVFRNTIDGSESLCLVKGQVQKDKPVVVRVHVEKFFEDFVENLFSANQSRLNLAMDKLKGLDAGVLLFLRVKNNETSLVDQVREFVASKELIGSTSSSSVEGSAMDNKDYGIGAQILRSLGLEKIILLSNSPTPRVGIKAFGLEIVKQVSLSNREQLEQFLSSESHNLL